MQFYIVAYVLDLLHDPLKYDAMKV